MTKYSTLVVLALIAFVSFSHGQKLDLYANLGYGIGMGGMLETSVTSNNATITKIEDKYFNYGQGIKLEGGANIYIAEKLPIQAGLIFSFGVPGFNTESSTTLLGITTTDETEWNFSTFGVKALIAPRFEILELLDMYAGVGMGLYFGSLNYKTTETSVGTFTENGSYKSAPSIAFLGSLGADFPIADMISLFGEIGFEQMAFVWTKQIIEKTTIRNHSPQTIIYEKNATNLPAPVKVPGANWQLRAGIRFSIL